MSKIIFQGDPTGRADSAAPLQEAIDQLAAQGGGTIVIPHGNYAMSTYRPTTHPCKFTNILVPSNVTLEGEGHARLRQAVSGRAPVGNCGWIENSVVGIANPSTFQWIAFQHGPFYNAHPVAANDAMIVTRVPGEAAQFSVGDLIGVYEQTTGDVIPSEFTEVTSVDPATGRIGLAVHLARNFPTAYLTKVTHWATRNVTLRNLTIQGAVPVEVQEAFNVTLENCDLRYDNTVGGNNIVTGFVINTVRNFTMVGGSVGPVPGGPLIGTELPQRNSADVTFEGVTFTGTSFATGEFGIHWKVSRCRFWLTNAGASAHGFALQGWNMLAVGNDFHARGYSSPGSACVTDFAGAYEHVQAGRLFGGVRFLGNSIYADNLVSGNPAVSSHLPGTQWSGNHIEANAGTVGAVLHGDQFVFSANHLSVAWVNWAILAESWAPTDGGVIANNVVNGGGSAVNGVDFPGRDPRAGGYVVVGNIFMGFRGQGVNSGALSAAHQGTVVVGNYGADSAAAAAKHDLAVAGPPEALAARAVAAGSPPGSGFSGSNGGAESRRSGPVVGPPPTSREAVSPAVQDANDIEKNRALGTSR